MRTCNDCHAVLRDYDMVCSECKGENLSEIIDENDSFNKREPISLKLVFSLVAILVVCVFIGVFVFNFITKDIPSRPAKAAVLNLVKGDLENYVTQMHSYYQVDAEGYINDNLGGYDQYSKEQKQSLISKFGENYKIKVEIVDVQPVSAVMQAAHNKVYYNEDVLITNAKYVTIKTHMYNDSGLEEVTSEVFQTVKIDGKWYLFDETFAGSTEG